jgi:hypothetical protein
MFKKNGIYSNNLPTSKEKLVIERHLPGVKPKKFYENSKASAFLKYYENDEKTVLEQSYEAILKDVEDTIRWLNTISYKKKIKIDVTIDIPREAGSKETIKHIVREMVEIDNSEEKTKALKVLEGLFDSIERFESKLEAQKLKNKKTQQLKAIFDN